MASALLVNTIAVELQVVSIFGTDGSKRRPVAFGNWKSRGASRLPQLQLIVSYCDAIAHRSVT